jgi:hypothetical protein
MKYILLSLIIILTSFTFCYGQEHTKGELYRFYKYWQPVNSKTDSVTFIKDTARYYTTMNGKPFIYAMQFLPNIEPEIGIDSLPIHYPLKDAGYLLDINPHRDNYLSADSIWVNKDSTYFIFRYYKN